MEQLFFELIRVAIGNAVRLSHTPTDDEWHMLYDMAKKQTILGICFYGVLRLKSQGQCPPKLLYLHWMGMAAKMQQRNEIVNQQSNQIYKCIKSKGYEACILKGQSNASLYGDMLKSLRQSGDIDVWMISEPNQCIEWARKNAKMTFYDYHHADLSIFQGTEVELHYRPSISRNLIRNKRLQKWFAEEGKKHIVYDEALGFCKPDYTFNVVLCLNHLLWHLMYEGVGMRQMMDLYFVLRTPINDEELKINDELFRLLVHFKLVKFTSACMWIMKSVFGLEDEHLLCEPNERLGKHLLSEIIQSGNFGKHDERLKDDRYKGSRMGLMMSWLKHNMRLLHYYPEDVLWTPIGILRISLWRRWNYRNENELKTR